MDLKSKKEDVFNKKISFTYFLLVLIITPLYILIFNNNFYGIILSIISLILAIISWKLSNRIDSDNYIAFVIVIFLNIIGFIPYLVFYFYKRRKMLKEFEVKKNKSFLKFIEKLKQ